MSYQSMGAAIAGGIMSATTPTQDGDATAATREAETQLDLLRSIADIVCQDALDDLEDEDLEETNLAIADTFYTG